ELEEVAADERSDDGEAALGPDALHLVPDRVAVVVEGLEICVHAGMGELHGSRSTRAGGGRLAIELQAESIRRRLRDPGRDCGFPPARRLLCSGIRGAAMSPTAHEEL